MVYERYRLIPHMYCRSDELVGLATTEIEVDLLLRGPRLYRPFSHWTEGADKDVLVPLPIPCRF